MSTCKGLNPINMSQRSKQETAYLSHFKKKCLMQIVYFF